MGIISLKLLFRIDEEYEQRKIHHEVQVTELVAIEAVPRLE